MDEQEKLEKKRKGNREASARMRARRKTERILVNGKLIHPNAPHGTLTGRTNYSCQCDLCNKENSLRSRQYYRDNHGYRKYKSGYNSNTKAAKKDSKDQG